MQLMLLSLSRCNTICVRHFCTMVNMRPYHTWQIRWFRLDGRRQEASSNQR